MSPLFPEEFSARLIDRNPFAIIDGMPPRDPDEDEEEDDEDDEDEGADEPAVVREPDED